ncbi:hypothetical protein H4R99_002045 [Coemansia sp. RSA 1722]|nr:hypothetical protein LPJ57_004714 [Coemansia sp. RSA 486]KAJ2595913.1 hypothetical protein GGF39_003656 [Coemansia sp. RSA 1721]KAJ2604060.1 hypothetical protein H4R99_002045 [Coemansia sp. RSA 1722]KAJ2638096.1 hypothetical protein GGF40_001908 [Coemansia sp. RSA 1286]KAJ2704496.1 hypothetical protein FB645_003218 [Coemansia sp. IMI 203386]
MYKLTSVFTFVLAALVASSPLPHPDGTLGGVVDAVAPITAGLGVTVNNLLGFKDTPGGGSSAPASGGSSTPASGGSSTPASGGSSAPASGGSSAPAAGGGSSAPAAAGGGSAVLGGVVDALAPITGGVGTTVNGLAGFK